MFRSCQSSFLNQIQHVNGVHQGLAPSPLFSYLNGTYSTYHHELGNYLNITRILVFRIFYAFLTICRIFSLINDYKVKVVQFRHSLSRKLSGAWGSECLGTYFPILFYEEYKILLPMRIIKRRSNTKHIWNNLQQMDCFQEVV